MKLDSFYIKGPANWIPALMNIHQAPNIIN